MPKYKKVLLKLSGEALLNGKKDGIIDFEFANSQASMISPPFSIYFTASAAVNESPAAVVSTASPISTGAM